MALVPASAVAESAAAKLVVQGVAKRFGAGPDAVQALEPLDLSVAPGEFVAIVGPSGCGKSTLLNIVAGFETPTRGRVLLDGKPITGPGRERGVVFQQGALFTWMSVLDNVAFGPRALGKSPSEAREIAMRYIELVGLHGFAQRYPYELSGGMQQRVGIARALTRQPFVLLMDEPFAALDAQTRETLQEDFLRIWKTLRTTVIFVTHSIDEALVMSDRVLVFTPRPGRIRRVIESPLGPDRADGDVRARPEFAQYRQEIRALLRNAS